MKQWITLLISLSAITTVTATEHEVKMLSWGKEGPMVYEPSVLRVEVGDTVTFLPTQPGHQVKSHTIPEGAEAFESELDKKFSITLDKEGIYVYFCPPHHLMNMSGLIQAGKPVNRADIDAAVKDVESRVNMNKKRLTDYLKRLDEMNSSDESASEKTAGNQSSTGEKVSTTTTTEEKADSNKTVETATGELTESDDKATENTHHHDH